MSDIISVAFFVGILGGMFPRAIPVISSAMGEVVSQNSGVLNLGVEGYMLIGGAVGFASDFFTGSLILAFLLAGLAGMVLASCHAFVSINLKADQVVSGTAMWFVGWGLSGVLYRAWFGSLTTTPTISTLHTLAIPYLSSIPVIGPIIFKQDPMAYIIILAMVAVQLFLYRTKAGLNLRAVGEDPRVAELAGVSVKKYRYAATLFCGFMSGIGGAYLILAVVGSYYYDITAGIGFVAVAMVYFGRWSPFRTFVGSLVFGAVYVAYLTLESYFQSIPYQFFAMWPYIATLLLIIAVGSRSKSPGALAKPYTKEG